MPRCLESLRRVQIKTGGVEPILLDAGANFCPDHHDPNHCGSHPRPNTQPEKITIAVNRQPSKQP
jgi:hypothetical protein